MFLISVVCFVVILRLGVRFRGLGNYLCLREGAEGQGTIAMSLQRTPTKKRQPTTAIPPTEARQKRKAALAREINRDAPSSSEEDDDDDSDYEPSKEILARPHNPQKSQKEPVKNHSALRPEPVEKESNPILEPRKESKITHKSLIGGAFEEALRLAGLDHLMGPKSKKAKKKEKESLERAAEESRRKKKALEKALGEYNKEKEKWEELRESYLAHFGEREGQKAVTSESDASDEGVPDRPEGVAPKANKSRREKPVPKMVPSLLTRKKWLKSSQPLEGNENIRSWGSKYFSKKVEDETLPAQLKKYKKESKDLWDHSRPHPMYKKRSMLSKVASRNLQETMVGLNFLAKHESDENKRNYMLASRDSILKSVALDHIARCASQKKMLEVYYRMDDEFRVVDSSANGALVEQVLPSVEKDKVSEAFQLMHRLGRANKMSSLAYGGGGGFRKGNGNYLSGNGRNREGNYGFSKGWGRSDRDFKGRNGGFSRGSSGEDYFYDAREERYKGGAPYGRYENRGRGRQNQNRGNRRNPKYNRRRNNNNNSFRRGDNPT